MALVKFGSFITSGSGKLGGHTIQKSKGGMQLKNKGQPLANPSQLQIRIRSINKQLQSGWRLLSEDQRKLWNNFPGIEISGHSLWMKYNFGYLFDNLPVITNPYDYKSVRLGPELCRDPNIINPFDWSFFPNTVFSNPGISFDIAAAGVPCWPNVGIDIFPTQKFLIISRASKVNMPLTFGNGWAPWEPIINGERIFQYQCNFYSTAFMFYCFAPGTAKLQYLSIRKIL